MNFVDVQPKSFLDYAWTTPSSAPMSNVKPSKTSRKQNRCCDQCRKGKRACDAAILEDTLLDKPGSSGDNPTVFHYSDVFGPLAPCGNCEKTKKNCTFEWLRSQRVSQATPQPSAMPPAKRRRKSSSATTPQNGLDAKGQTQTTSAPQSTVVSDTATNGGGILPRIDPAELGVTFADFPTGSPAFDLPIASLIGFGSNNARHHDNEAGLETGSGCLDEVGEEEDVLMDHDSGKGSSLETCSEGMDDSPHSDGPPSLASYTTCNETIPTKSDVLVRMPRKRRRRSSSSGYSNGRVPYPSFLSANSFLASTNSTFLAESLLKVYHDSFENALSCWLTERTCPYSKDSEVSLANDAGPDWNRIYHRVFRLDRLAAPIRGRRLTFSEDKAAAKAINAAIFSFATQWAQSGQRSKARYPFHNDGSDERSRVFRGNAEVSSVCKDFDRTLQVAAWHEARQALQNAAEIESFRVVLAQIVFSLTQKPVTAEKVEAQPYGDPGLTPNDSPVPSDLDPADSFNGTTGVDECEDLLSRLNLTFDGEGPPVHLEQGLRLIHSLRSRMAMNSGMSLPSSRCAKKCKSSSERLDAGDRATVDLLFWLGIMFDTLSSAMHKRPLVVSDEDSDIYSNEPRTAEKVQNFDAGSVIATDTVNETTEGLWDDYLFARQRKRLHGYTVRWPCSYDQAAALLCDAAPVKVLLFRKVTRIQTLLSRNIRGARVERAIRAALDVYDHWGKLYAPFIGDCVEMYESLPSRIQSWCICLTGHWHLATLLLADLLEIIDASELSVASKRQERACANFVAKFREQNCRSLSDLARCACPHEDASFAKSGDFHFAVNKGALLTEPWTAVLIRAFATAGVVLLESESSLNPEVPDVLHQEDAFRRADDCVKALWYLGRKSDMALAAAKILGDALRQRRKGIEEKVNDMSSFLEAELWEGFEEMHGAFGVECVS
ncbi:hypothetical protein K491DRAFT_705578 [Lophiostoma macrostomum CBS 122681]|uniref:Uncharacterized protein n=1 Tax=Lophiostoma macrostomum CBS 122681 TaxID=1314788 RepID=A0A6A6T1Q4_9PLEO|nr:hypothetical protein K491DRAFT_705578 [Lophiostoma macrostomum CBS 122681]